MGVEGKSVGGHRGTACTAQAMDKADIWVHKRTKKQHRSHLLAVWLPGYRGVRLMSQDDTDDAVGEASASDPLAGMSMEAFLNTHGVYFPLHHPEQSANRFHLNNSHTYLLNLWSCHGLSSHSCPCLWLAWLPERGAGPQGGCPHLLRCWNCGLSLPLRSVVTARAPRGAPSPPLSAQPHSPTAMKHITPTQALITIGHNDVVLFLFWWGPDSLW